MLTAFSCAAWILPDSLDRENENSITARADVEAGSKALGEAMDKMGLKSSGSKGKKRSSSDSEGQKKKKKTKQTKEEKEDKGEDDPEKEEKKKKAEINKDLR
ncbi:unnamed protein product, partial [Symbiodinium microadriaticum]